MDKNFFYQKRAQEHQREISQELANRHLLNSPKVKSPAARRGKRMVLRIMPAAILFITLVLLYFLR